MRTECHNGVLGADFMHIDKRVGKRIQQAIDGLYNQTELAKALNRSPSLVSKWIRGERPVSLEDLERIAHLTGKPITYFFDDFDTLHLDPKFTDIISGFDLSVIPVYQFVRAGKPAFVMEWPDDYVTVPREIVRNARFAVRVKGDSMVGLGIHDGDILFIRPQDEADDGDIVVARVNGDEFTVKRLRKRCGELPVLESAHQDYPPIVAEDVRIVGKVVGLFRAR